MNEHALEAAAQAMCDRVNGQGDYAENIGQRRSGWLAQARAGIEAYLAASPKATATASVRELLEERIANYSALRDQAVDAGTDENGYAMATEALERVLASLQDSGTADTHAGSVREALTATKVMYQDEIALLRRTLIEMGRMIPGVALHDGVSSSFLALLPTELAAALHPDSRAQGGEKA